MTSSAAQSTLLLDDACVAYMDATSEAALNLDKFLHEPAISCPYLVFLKPFNMRLIILGRTVIEGDHCADFML